MSYKGYFEREDFEKEGNLSLYLDVNTQDFYVLEKGARIYFEIPYANQLPNYINSRLGINWIHKDTSDIFAAEKEEDTIRIITRGRLDVGDTKTPHYMIYIYSNDGKYIDMELSADGGEWDHHFHPHKGDEGFSVYDKKRVQELTRHPLSELEEWAINTSGIFTEYLNTGGGNDIRETDPNTNGRLEEGAYYKYQELNPNHPMLGGFGVKKEKKTNAGSTSNHDRVYAPDKFNKKSADKITNFNPSTDKLEIDTDSFGIDSSATFATAKNKRKLKKLAKKDFDFLYDQKKGGLYFNENGSDKGFGDGGIIAILKGAPELTASNLEFI